MSTTPASPAAPARVASPALPRPNRFLGVDLARGIAMLGMFVIHVGPLFDGALANTVSTAAHGRSAILFATIGGLSLALMTGGSTPPVGRDRRRASLQIAIRAVLLLLLGSALTALGTPVYVIIAFYGAYFLLALPFLGLRPRTLFILAGGIALFGFVARAVANAVIFMTGVDKIEQPFDPFFLISSIGAPEGVAQGYGLLDFVATGPYPALIWMAFIFAGLGLGRLGLDSIRPGRLALVGGAIMVAAYGLAWLIPQLLRTFVDPLVRSEGVQTTSDSDGAADVWSGIFGAEPHTGTLLEVTGGIGTAFLIIAICLVVARRYPRATWPIAAVGTMPLTIYTAHIVAIFALGSLLPTEQPWWVLPAFTVCSIAFAMVWLTWFRRGPLEQVVHFVSTRPLSIAK